MAQGGAARTFQSAYPRKVGITGTAIVLLMLVSVLLGHSMNNFGKVTTGVMLFAIGLFLMLGVAQSRVIANMEGIVIRNATSRRFVPWSNIDCFGLEAGRSARVVLREGRTLRMDGIVAIRISPAASLRVNRVHIEALEALAALARQNMPSLLADRLQS